MVAYAKANPNKLNFAGNEPGGVRHFLLERIKAQTGTQIANIPYKGDAASLADRLGGIVELGISAAGFKPHIDTGKLVALATTGPRRMSEFPQVPTLEESGYKGFTMTSWFGLVAPAGTPPEVIGKLNAELKRVFSLPDVQDRLKMLGLEPWLSTPEELARYQAAEIVKWAKVVKDSGAKAE